MRVLLFLSWYIIPLSLLISLSFLKPLSIVFQDGIWSICFNVVVCARIQRRKKKTIERKKKFKEKKERKSVRKKKIKRVLIKFWEVKCKEEVLLWRRRVKKKKMLNGNSKKSWHSDKSWKHLLFLPSPIFISFPLLLPYITL